MSDDISTHLRRMRVMNDVIVLRTRYAIRLTAAMLNGAADVVYVGEQAHWTNKAEHVKTFHSMTSANAHAIIDLGLSLDQFTVEAL